MLAAHRADGVGRLRLAAALACAALLFTSCKVDVHLGVRVAENGSGAVRARFVLDQDALEAVGGDLAGRLRVADLVQASWKVEVDDTEGGGAEAVAEKAFARPEELTAIIDELSGDVGPFREFVLRRDRSLFRTEFTFKARVDLKSGVGPSTLDPADEGIAAELADEDVEVEELGEFLAERVDRAFGFEVVVDLPGEGSNNAPKHVGDDPRWAPRVGEVVELKAESSETDLDRIALVVIGGVLTVAAVAAVGVFTGWRFRRRRASSTDVSE